MFHHQNRKRQRHQIELVSFELSNQKENTISLQVGVDSGR